MACQSSSATSLSFNPSCRTRSAVTPSFQMRAPTLGGRVAEACWRLPRAQIWSRGPGMVSSTRIMGISSHGNFKNRIDHREQSHEKQIRLTIGHLGASNSQKRARTMAETTSSLERFSPAVRVATSRTQRRASRSPSRVSAWRMEWTSFWTPNPAELR
jgi:hypothetical protein